MVTVSDVSIMGRTGLFRYISFKSVSRQRHKFDIAMIVDEYSLKILFTCLIWNKRIANSPGSDLQLLNELPFNENYDATNELFVVIQKNYRNMFCDRFCK